jgi:hypothetical protein
MKAFFGVGTSLTRTGRRPSFVAPYNRRQVFLRFGAAIPATNTRKCGTVHSYPLIAGLFVSQADIEYAHQHRTFRQHLPQHPPHRPLFIFQIDFRHPVVGDQPPWRHHRQKSRRPSIEGMRHLFP